MFRNYLKIALRQLRKQKLYSFIKIGGFALGIAACLLIALYIRHELSYDRDYANGNRLYRVIQVYRREDGSVGKGPAMPAGFAKAMAKEFPEVELAGRIMPYPLFGGAGSNEVRAEGKQQNIYDEAFTYADQAMLEMFGFRMVYGDRTRALTEPGSMVLSKRKADKYFPGQDPVGKLIYLNDDMQHPHKIGGVIADPAANSHLQYDFYLSLAGYELWKGEQDRWTNDNYDTYALLKPGEDAKQVQGKLVVLFQKYLLPQLQSSGTKNPQDIINRCTFILQPVADIHLRSTGISDSLTHGDIRMVWLYGAVGIFILLLAGINFINLSTARSAGRAKEVGLRKVVGSRRSGLIGQFLTESLLMSYFSFILAIGLAWLFMPLFNRMTAAGLRMPWGEWWLLPVLVGAATVIGLLAGFYPALYLSRFKPVEVLKSAVSPGSRRSGLRSVLVVFQFTTSVVLIVGTLVVYRQMRFILNKKMGYDKDQVMLIQGTGSVDTGNSPHRRFLALKTDLLQLPEVKKVSVSDFLPVTGGKRNENTFWKDGKEKTDQGLSSQDWWVDPDYFATMGMKLLRGRSFDRDIASDTTAVIVNETMAARLGFKDPLNQLIDYGVGSYKMHIIGVVADFNFESVKEPVGPLALHRGDWATMVALKTNTKDMAALIKAVAGIWKRYCPQQDLRYTFMDESYARMYADVQRTQSMVTSMATLAVVIACLGLFALSAFMAERRRREIGIRKVLGATVRQLTGLLSGEFIRLVLISIVIATPVAYWGMHVWLQDFIYRVDLGWWVFVVAGVLVVGIALLTVSLQAVRAAMASPAGSLRAE
jgi:putative ABC transport system permease protein